MNVNFLYINDDKVVVTDEHGNLIIRDAKNDMADILEAENRIDVLDEHIKNLKNGIKIEEKTIELGDKWLKMIGVISMGIVITLPFVIGVMSSAVLLGVWLVAGGSSCLYEIISNHKSEKRIKGYNNEINKANDIKKEIKEDLAINEDMARGFKIPHSNIGEVIIINSEEDFEVQNKRLNSAFKSGYREKEKVLIKKYK